MTRLTLLTLLAVAFIASAAMADDMPPVSGLARLSGSNFLLVQDTKADKPGPRLQVAMLAAGATMLQPVQEQWVDGDLPNDLESLTPIPGQPGEFLTAESGYRDGRFGRIFHIRVTQRQDGGWSSQVLHVIPLPAIVSGEVEGIAVAARDDGTPVLAISERGGQAPYAPAWLWWGGLNLPEGSPDGEFVMTDESQYGIQLTWPDSPPGYPWSRGCSDLYLDAGGYLWGASADDPGDDGPFRSTIYRIGRFDADQSYPINFDMSDDMVWHVDGFKVEALCDPVIPGSLLTFATDDENFGGLWRPLPPADPRPRQQVYYGGE